MPRSDYRDLKKEKFWRRMIGSQARSGVSISAWCRRQALREPSFYWWRRRLARTARKGMARSRKPTPFAARPTALGSMGEQGPALVPVRVLASEGGSAEGLIEIVLSGDRRIRVGGPVDRRLLADVLAVLEAAPC